MPVTDADLERGRKLRLARTSKKLSQREVADRTGVPQPYISFYEQGDPRYPLDAETFETLMDAIKEAPPPSAREGQKTIQTSQFRLNLPPKRARHWNGLEIDARSAIVNAGYDALEKKGKVPK